YKRHIIIDILCHRNKTASIYTQCFAGCEFLFMHGSAVMYKCQSIALKFLHNKTFTAEKADARLFLKFNSDRHTFCSSKKGIFLTNQFPIQLAQIHWHNFTRIWGSEGYVFFAGSLIC